MPNIELHGLPTEKGEELRRRIFELLGDLSFIQDIVVTICPTDVEDVKGNKQPFLRVCSTYSHEYDHVRKLHQRLPSLGMDIEYFEVKAFVPRNIPEIYHPENIPK